MRERYTALLKCIATNLYVNMQDDHAQATITVELAELTAQRSRLYCPKDKHLIQIVRAFEHEYAIQILCNFDCCWKTCDFRKTFGKVKDLSSYAFLAKDEAGNFVHYTRVSFDREHYETIRHDLTERASLSIPKPLGHCQWSHLNSSMALLKTSDFHAYLE